MTVSTPYTVEDMMNDLPDLLEDLDEELVDIEGFAGPVEDDPEHYSRLRARIAMVLRYFNGGDDG